MKRLKPSRTESGFAGGAEALIFGMLLFVVGTLLVANAWNVVDTKTATVAAAREAGRAFVEADNPGDARAAAQQAADNALSGYGRTSSKGHVDLSAASFGRCQRISVRVSYPVPLVVLPFLGRIGAAGAVQSVHSELVDPYRTGLPGISSCH